MLTVGCWLHRTCKHLQNLPETYSWKHKKKKINHNNIQKSPQKVSKNQTKTTKVTALAGLFWTDILRTPTYYGWVTSEHSWHWWMVISISVMIRNIWVIPLLIMFRNLWQYSKGFSQDSRSAQTPWTTEALILWKGL